MSNILCVRKNNRFTKFHNQHITNTDDFTHNIEFGRHIRLHKMSIAKAKFVDTDNSIIGYFQLIWQAIPPINIPQCKNTAVAFTGWADPATAIQLSSSAFSSFSNNTNTWITLGGGLGSNGTCSAGAFSRTVLNNIYKAISNQNFTGYNGIVFDVEYVLGTGL